MGREVRKWGPADFVGYVLGFIGVVGGEERQGCVGGCRGEGEVEEGVEIVLRVVYEANAMGSVNANVDIIAEGLCFERRFNAATGEGT